MLVLLLLVYKVLVFRVVNVAKTEREALSGSLRSEDGSPGFQGISRSIIKSSRYKVNRSSQFS